MLSVVVLLSLAIPAAAIAGQALAARALGREDLATRACEELDEIRRATDEEVKAAACASGAAWLPGQGP